MKRLLAVSVRERFGEPTITIYHKRRRTIVDFSWPHGHTATLYCPTSRASGKFLANFSITEEDYYDIVGRASSDLDRLKAFPREYQVHKNPHDRIRRVDAILDFWGAFLPQR